MHLLTWNPQRWAWDTLAADLATFRTTGSLAMRWSCGHTRRIELGERVYLMRLGLDPKGIVGSGYVTRTPFDQPHWDSDRASSGDTALCVEVEFDQLAEQPFIPLSELEDRPFSGMSWTPQGSGVGIPPEIADDLELAWAQHTRAGAARGPDELVGGLALLEGAVRSVVVNGRLGTVRCS